MDVIAEQSDGIASMKAEERPTGYAAAAAEFNGSTHRRDGAQVAAALNEGLPCCRTYSTAGSTATCSGSSARIPCSCRSRN